MFLEYFKFTYDSVNSIQFSYLQAHAIYILNNILRLFKLRIQANSLIRLEQSIWKLFNGTHLLLSQIHENFLVFLQNSNVN